MEKRTKQLAWCLGVLRKQRASGQLATGDVDINQVFRYAVVIDFESTCWEDRGKQQASQEIIEFPAILLDLRAGEIVDQFHFYVQPRDNPQLSEFCKDFTGITQDQVDLGVPLHTCLYLFKKWLQKLEKDFGLKFHSAAKMDSSLCCFVTWSDWDLGVCLRNECRRKQIPKPDVLNAWVDLRKTYKTFYQRSPNGLRGAMEDVGLTFEGREHSGLADSINTARLTHKMVTQGCVLQLTKQLDK